MVEHTGLVCGIVLHCTDLLPEFITRAWAVALTGCPVDRLFQ